MTTLRIAKVAEGARPVTLADLKAMPVSQVASQWASACAALEAAKARHELVHAALVARFLKRAQRLLGSTPGSSPRAGPRTGLGGPVGTEHVIEDGLDIAVELPRRDEVDQIAMTCAIPKLEKLAGVSWRDIVNVEYSVSRTTLKGLAGKARSIVEKAIVTKAGKPRFTITQAKPLAAEQAAGAKRAA